MEEILFPWAFESLLPALAFTLVGFVAVAILVGTTLEKLKVPQSLQQPLMAATAMIVVTPPVLWWFYSPFVAVKVSSDHIELRYLWPRPSETVPTSEISCVNLGSVSHGAKQSRSSTGLLKIHVRGKSTLCSVEVPPSDDSIEKAEKLISALIKKPEPAEQY